MERRDFIRGLVIGAVSTAVGYHVFPSVANFFRTAAHETTVPAKLQAGRYWEIGTNAKRVNWTIEIDQKGGEPEKLRSRDVTRSFEYNTNFPDLSMMQKFVFYANKGASLREEVSMFSKPGQDPATELKTPLYYDQRYDNKIKREEFLNGNRAYIVRNIVMEPDGEVLINDKIAPEGIAYKYRMMFYNVAKTCQSYLLAQEAVDAADNGGKPLPKGAFYESVARAIRPELKRLETPSTEPQPFLPQILGGVMPKAAPIEVKTDRRSWLQNLKHCVAG